MSGSQEKPRRKRVLNGCAIWILCFITFNLAWCTALPPSGVSYENRGRSIWMQTSRTLALACFAYSMDHDVIYPAGKSSTEICQKLLDGKYVGDPAIFYVPMAGKTAPVPGQPLKPENVCWDFTVRADGSGLDSNDPDAIPVVFLTGYKVDYIAGGNARPVIKPYPVFYYRDVNLPWYQWWRGAQPMGPALAVAYKGNSANLILLDGEGVIPHVVPEDFDGKVKVYRQLTPDGPLP